MVRAESNLGRSISTSSQEAGAPVPLGDERPVEVRKGGENGTGVRDLRGTEDEDGEGDGKLDERGEVAADSNDIWTGGERGDDPLLLLWSAYSSSYSWVRMTEWTCVWVEGGGARTSVVRVSAVLERERLSPLLLLPLSFA